ncbi:replication initiation protein RepC [Agrobacterium sp. a22-2]|uniref:plasmid replication protein RepC n=1 Tax=Agrobacterium sp. a22-2 TaxID=2283840 RepID=UPI001446CE32|nr:plasmid replication protein RepC [Agrobacterium sp. a22-2]NKN38711.1 replication initiation protein RepC [Agrobacterium sp. a22-2]
MMERLATTPFGGGRMSARLFARQAKVGARQEELRNGNGGNETGRADKWQLLRALTEAREVFGLGDRTICLLEALVSFYSERELDGKQPLIVFPSNRELAMRARGMAPATIRRHLAALVDTGMIFRRDSANGKRFCRRDDTGEVEEAFGFDLAPLALKADEIYAAAEAARAEAKAIRVLRGEITVHLRDISKVVATAMEESRPGDWVDFALRLAALSGRLPRRARLSDMEPLLADLRILRDTVETAYLNSLTEQEMSANDHHFERHIQNSNTDLPSESNGLDHNTGGSAQNSGPAPERKMAISLTKLQKLCPQLKDYAKGGISSWADVLKTAELVRSMLGISADAWTKAKQAMGPQAAAVTIAVMLERAETIRSAGGYLRNLTEKAEKGAFSIYPMLQALERAKT